MVSVANRTDTALSPKLVFQWVRQTHKQQPEWQERSLREPLGHSEVPVL